MSRPEDTICKIKSRRWTPAKNKGELLGGVNPLRLLSSGASVEVKPFVWGLNVDRGADVRTLVLDLLWRTLPYRRHCTNQKIYGIRVGIRDCTSTHMELRPEAGRSPRLWVG